MFVKVHTNLKEEHLFYNYDFFLLFFFCGGIPACTACVYLNAFGKRS